MKSARAKKMPTHFKKMPTHFVALQIKDKGIHDKVEELQSKLGEHEKYKTFLVAHQKSHLSIIVFHLANDDDMEKAKSSLDRAASEIKKRLDGQPLSVCINGLNHFGNRVLFAAVDENQILNKVADTVIGEFTASGLFEMKWKKDKFNPHMTLMKIGYRRMFEGVKKIDESIWLKYKETDFGVENISHLQLCSMVDQKDINGYYHVCHSSSFVDDDNDDDDYLSNPEGESVSAKNDLELSLSHKGIVKMKTSDVADVSTGDPDVSENSVEESIKSENKDKTVDIVSMSTKPSNN